MRGASRRRARARRGRTASASTRRWRSWTSCATTSRSCARRRCGVGSGCRASRTWRSRCSRRARRVAGTRGWCSATGRCWIRPRASSTSSGTQRMRVSIVSCWCSGARRWSRASSRCEHGVTNEERCTVSSDSAIEWTDATANFWRGCEKVSPGCAHCYMFRDQRRYGRDPSVVVRAAAPTFYAPQRAKKWAEQAEQIRAEEGRRMRVFTCSWSDFFHPDADEWREEAWDVIRACPQYDWQILTKRPELVRERLPADW